METITFGTGTDTGAGSESRHPAGKATAKGDSHADRAGRTAAHAPTVQRKRLYSMCQKPNLC